jgi:phage terminase large subunit
MVEVWLSKPVHEVFSPPLGSLRYRGLYGGRGGGKSYPVALVAATWAANRNLSILCTREYQNSIKDSFHKELKSAIAGNDWLAPHYDIGVDYLRCKTTGSEFFFKGLQNTDSIKSFAQIDICIVEEAETVTESQWVDLIPTIRKPNSEIWVLWNPRKKGSPTDSRFRLNPHPDSVIRKVGWQDNRFFPKVLKSDRLHDLETLSPEMYNHIWEGEYLQISDAQVFKGKFVKSEFEIGKNWDGAYCGLDFGFSRDPTAAVQMWINDNTLYISHEAVKVGLEIDETARFINDKIPDFGRNKIIADSARPESRSFLRRHGFPMCQGAKKGKGSVEDGVAFIKSFDRVVIHPRCTETYNEFCNYSYKQDRLTKDILPTILDANNHCIDAIRYGLEPIMKNQNCWLLD